MGWARAAHLGHALADRRALASLALASLALAGCSAVGTDLKQSLSASTPLITAAIATDDQEPTAVAMANIVGAPHAFVDPFLRKLDESAAAHNIALLVDASLPAAYTLRGYIISDRDSKGVKLSYVWDVFDKAGNRIDRISGEEHVAAGTLRGGDVWSAIPADIQAKIANETITALAAAVRPAQPGAKPKI